MIVVMLKKIQSKQPSTLQGLCHFNNNTKCTLCKGIKLQVPNGQLPRTPDKPLPTDAIAPFMLDSHGNLSATIWTHIGNRHHLHQVASSNSKTLKCGVLKRFRKHAKLKHWFL